MPILNKSELAAICHPNIDFYDPKNNNDETPF